MEQYAGRHDIPFHALSRIGVRKLCFYKLSRVFVSHQLRGAFNLPVEPVYIKLFYQMTVFSGQKSRRDLVDRVQKLLSVKRAFVQRFVHVIIKRGQKFVTARGIVDFSAI